MFWEYDTRLGKRWNIDPKRNMSISPYSAFQNNPILFSDVNGDSVSLGNTYDKNDKGQLLYPDKVRQFELFASTNEGRAYLLDHAQKGFSLKGEIVKDLDIQASEEGAASASGVDITFKVGEVSSIAGAATSSHFVGGINKSHGARLKTEFIFPNKNMKYFTRPGEADISGVGSYAHETLLHGISHRNDYLHDYIFTGGLDHSDKSFNGSQFEKAGLSIMKQAQSKLNTMTSGGIKYQISEARMGAMMHWGRGPEGWFRILNNREAKDGEMVDFKQVVEKVNCMAQ